MYRFVNDYSEGAHPNILAALERTNMEQTAGYGHDPYSEQAVSLIREKTASPTADVHFLMSGTMVNLVSIHAFLRSFEAVIAVSTAHVCEHEAGAIEATGHKVIDLPSPDGKLTPSMIESALAAHNGTEHMVHPRLVYISNTTEIGTVYTRGELAALRKCCDANNLYIYCDGARLASALTTKEGEMSLSDFAAFFDAFTIGGTKTGLLFGEALVIRNDALRANFRCYMKQRGALCAKGRLLGIQYLEILKDDLYFTLGRRSNKLALRIRDAFAAASCLTACPSPSNQQFVCLPRAWYDALTQEFAFEPFPAPTDDENHITVRVCTSWATDEAAVDRLIAAVDALKKQS